MKNRHLLCRFFCVPCLWRLIWLTAAQRSQRAESREQRAESREQRAESREQRAESREQDLIIPLAHR
ncbi:hypothetical protein C3737_05200 [Aeromonas jandaei]|nr:hypothetical protein C3737_05200 [Aeromonas jandaei]